MIDVVEEMVDTKTAEMVEEIDSAEAITVEAAMKTVWTGIGNVLSVTITTLQEETSVTDVAYLVPAAVAVDTEAVVMAEEILVEAAVAVDTEAVVMAEEILVEATIDAIDETVHQEEGLRVQDLDLLRERNLATPTTVDRVRLDLRVTIEDKIEVIKWVQNTIT